MHEIKYYELLVYNCSYEINYDLRRQNYLPGLSIVKVCLTLDFTVYVTVILICCFIIRLLLVDTSSCVE